MAFSYIQSALKQRADSSLLRVRQCVEKSGARFIELQNKRFLNFASNDYLGLGDKSLPQFSNVGMGSRSSALVTGYQKCHYQLEQRLCQVLGYESAMLFSSGFSANAGTLKALFNEQQSKSAVFQDKLNHASLIDGVLQSGAKHIRFNHNDTHHLRARLEKSTAENKLIVTEGVFSMDGDQAPVEKIHHLANVHNAWTMIDDAHSFGVLNKNGLGTVGAGYKPNILIITFGKAMASQGAAVLADNNTINYLTQFNRDYIYSTAMSPVMVKTAQYQLERLLDADRERRKLNLNIQLFKELSSHAKLAVLDSNTAIQPLILGSSERTLEVQHTLRQHGFWLTAIRPPTVAQNTARLRITLTAAHTDEDIEHLVNALKSYS